jgi:hypothetical protein
MNQAEAAKVLDAARTVLHGPGRGWEEVCPPEKLDDLRLWLKTWVVTPLLEVGGRYKKSTRAGIME